jgi:predicted Rossmann fold nucleotide-binding protein DprA/Smf involved in DNA uptake
LIRENKANIVTCADDVRELLGEGVGLFTADEETLGPLEKRAIDALLRKWQPLEMVATHAGLTHGEAKIALTSLEIDGLAEASLLGWRRTGSNL